MELLHAQVKEPSRDANCGSDVRRPLDLSEICADEIFSAFDQSFAWRPSARRSALEYGIDAASDQAAFGT